MTLDLTTHYGGLKLNSPIVLGACPLSLRDDMRHELEAAGIGAMVLPSLFEEQVLGWERQHRDRDAVIAAGDIETYLSLVNNASSQMQVPIIASLNGHSTSHWTDFAGELEEAGAAAIELNLHHPPPDRSIESERIEAGVIEMVHRIRQTITVPLFVKLDRQYTSLPHLVCRLLSGVQGVVLFGRQAELNLSLDDLTWSTDWGLTPAGSITASLRSIAEVHSHCAAMSIAASGGIGSADDVLKSLLAGADVAMVVSLIYRHGPDAVRRLNDDLTRRMHSYGWTSLRDLYAHRPLRPDSSESRAEYQRVLATGPD